MLWYKAWRESRTRFLLSAGTLTALCVVSVFFHREAAAGFDDAPASYAFFITRVTYRGYLREVFLLLVLILGLGGLLRERAYGTAGFTLALPVSRTRLVLTRAAVGLVEVAFLASIPALTIPLLSPLAHETYSIATAIRFAGLWIGVGAIVYGTAFLASTVFDGEYSAPVAALAILIAQAFIADLPPLERYRMNINDVMSGSNMPFFRVDSATFVGPFPWSYVLSFLLVTCVILASSARIARRQDF